MGIGSRSSISLLLLLSIFLLSLSPSQSAPAKTKPKFNIFTFLADHPEYSDFLDLLNRTQLADYMATSNVKQFTVLVIRNGALGDVIPKQKLDVLQPMLCAHVLMEFIDSSTLQYGNMIFPHQSVTVYQSTGVAVGEQGQVRFYRASTAFWVGSGVKGQRPTVKIVKGVRSDHIAHSVLEVSGFIVTPGISDDILPPPAAPLEAPSPKKSKPLLAPTPDEGDDAVADAPADSSPAESPADTPAESPAADEEDSPADAKSVPDKKKDKPVADEPATDSSSAGRFVSSLVGRAFIGCVLAAIIL